MIDMFNAADTARVVGACREFVYTERFINACSKLGAEIESAV